MRTQVIESLTKQADEYKKQLEAAIQAQENLSRRIDQLRGAIAALEAVQLPPEPTDEEVKPTEEQKEA
jgi:phage shock protein A